MTLRLTPDMLARMYDYLDATEPFNEWGMPDSEDVAFRILKTKERTADYRFNAGKHEIRLSENGVGHTASIAETVAHEMIHLRQKMLGLKQLHGRAFKKMSVAVCASHGFDPKTF